MATLPFVPVKCCVYFPRLAPQNVSILTDVIRAEGLRQRTGNLHDAIAIPLALAEAVERVVKLGKAKWGPGTEFADLFALNFARRDAMDDLLTLWPEAQP